MSYDDDSGAPTWELIEERWVTARRPHPCDGACSHGIQVGESYLRVAGKVDGDFTLTLTCGYCHSGYARPGMPEHDAELAEAERMARQDEEDYRYDQAMFRRIVAEADPSDLLYAHALANLDRETS